MFFANKTFITVNQVVPMTKEVKIPSKYQGKNQYELTAEDVKELLTSFDGLFANLADGQFIFGLWNKGDLSRR